MTPSPSSDPERTRQEILRLEREIMAAIRAKEAAVLARYLADDFVYRRPGAPDTPRDAFLRGVADLPVDVVALEGEGLAVSLFDDVAVLSGVQRATTRGADGDADEVSRGAFVDVFVRRDGGWLMAVAVSVDL